MTHVPYIHYDLSHKLKSEKYPLVRKDLTDLLTPFLVDVLSSASSSSQQYVLRVNCLDCLDRTNLTQYFAFSAVASSQLKNFKIPPEVGEPILREMWIHHGTVISQLYAGTPMLLADSILHERRTFVGTLSDAPKSLCRYIQQHFFDGQKQDGISLVTLQHNPSAPHQTLPRRKLFISFLLLFLASMFFTACINLFVLLFYPSFSSLVRQIAVSFVVLILAVTVRKDAYYYTDYPRLLRSL
jgi:hypothetical protein